MLRFTYAVAATIAATLIVPASNASASSRKISGLNLSAVPPSYGHTRVPRIVRGFNPKQKVGKPNNGIGLARRR